MTLQKKRLDEECIAKSLGLQSVIGKALQEHMRQHGCCHQFTFVTNKKGILEVRFDY